MIKCNNFEDIIKKMFFLLLYGTQTDMTWVDICEMYMRLEGKGLGCFLIHLVRWNANDMVVLLLQSRVFAVHLHIVLAKRINNYHQQPQLKHNYFRLILMNKSLICVEEIIPQ